MSKSIINYIYVGGVLKLSEPADSRFQNWPWFLKLSKICWSNSTKQNITNLFPLLYKPKRLFRCNWLLLFQYVGRLQRKEMLIDFRVTGLDERCETCSIKIALNLRKNPIALASLDSILCVNGWSMCYFHISCIM